MGMHLKPSDSLAGLIVWSRLLVLQSKRLLLAVARRRLRRTGGERDRVEAETLRRETESAQNMFRASRAAGEFDAPSGLRLEARDRLIEQGKDAVARLRRTAQLQTAAQQFETATDVQMLEELIEEWGQAVRRVDS